MLSFLVALRNAVIVALLAWLGLDAAESSTRAEQVEPAAAAVFGLR